jgi:catechol 2,3-dioxygenase-like lactoylglutathione lyase family enzyme
MVSLMNRTLLTDGVVMASTQFRFAFFTSQYEATVAFYRDHLELPVVGEWDRSPDDRGAIFAAASGMIEVLARPDGPSDHFFDERPPQGAFMVVEVDDLDERYLKAVRKGLPIQQELKGQSWGHRSFCVRDPNGLTLYLFAHDK